MKNIIFLVLFLLFITECNGAEALNTFEVQQMIEILKDNSRKCLLNRNKAFCKKGIKPRRKATGWCYRYVKIALFESGMTSKYIDGGSAIQAGKYLEEEGFINLLKTSKKKTPKAPIGSILVYKTKRNRHGHIEVKTNSNEFISDHVRNNTDGKLIGIYIKPSIREEGYGLANNYNNNCRIASHSFCIYSTLY